MQAIDKNLIQPQEGMGSEEMTYAIWSLFHGFATFRMNEVGRMPADLTSTEQLLLRRPIDSFR